MNTYFIKILITGVLFITPIISQGESLKERLKIKPKIDYFEVMHTCDPSFSYIYKNIYNFLEENSKPRNPYEYGSPERQLCNRFMNEIRIKSIPIKKDRKVETLEKEIEMLKRRIDLLEDE